jgi:hypothetical protein
MIESLDLSSLSMVLGTCLVIGMSALVILLFLGDGRQKIGFWGGFGLSVAACGVAIIAQNYLGLIDWIILGITGVSISASLFVTGMVVFVCVMFWNLIATGGRQLVR